MIFFAAWFDLHNDDVVADHPTALRVYARLVRIPLISEQPQAIKAYALAQNMHVKRESVSAALTLLIERGYLVDHGRTSHQVRLVTLVTERAETTTGAVSER